MASYPAPTEELPTFSPSVFNTNDIPLTIEEGEKFFITYPTAQGAITIPTLTSGTLNVSGTLTTETLNVGTLTTTQNVRNLGFGYQALLNRVAGSGTHNTAFGYHTLRALTLGGDNTAIGDNALPILTGANSVAENNTAVGHQAGLFLAEGTDNTFVGFNAGAGTSSHTGCNFNTCVGSGAGSILTTGDNNVFFGFEAGNGIITGSDNTFIGHTADTNNSAGTFRTAIGSGASGTANSTITLGRIANSATRANYEVVRLNHIEPQYTTLTQTTGHIGFQYSPTTTYSNPTASGTTIATQALPIGIWSINVNMAFTGAFVQGSLAIKIGATTIAVIPIVQTTGTGSLVAAANGGIIYAMTTAATATLVYDGTSSSTMAEVAATSVFQITRIA